MRQPKLTPWYPGHIKPARPGVYQVRICVDGTNWYQCWTGKYWGLLRSTPDWAATETGRSQYQSNDWRGLAEKQ